MYNETFKIIVVIVLTVSGGGLSAQVSGQAPALKAGSDGHYAVRKMDYDFKSWLKDSSAAKDKNNFHEKFRVEKQLIFTGRPNLASGITIRPDLYTSNFGFFCRKELQVEKVTRLPLRFRLGSLAQCNMLEQKY